MALLNWKVLVRLLLAAAGGMGMLCAEASDLEQQVKAAFLLNFARFTQWPPEMSRPGEPLGICLLGRDSFGSVLNQTLRDKSVNGRTFQIRRLTDTSALNGCHILFVSGDSNRFTAVLRSAESAGILTVGDAPGFAEDGGMIGFFLAGNKVRFHINPEAALRAHIRLSAQLLQLATIVHEPVAKRQ